MSIWDTVSRVGIERRLARIEETEGPDSAEAKDLRSILLLMDTAGVVKQKPRKPKPESISPELFAAIALSFIRNAGRPIYAQEVLMQLQIDGLTLGEDAAERLETGLLSSPYIRRVDGRYWLSDRELPEEVKDTGTRH